MLIHRAWETGSAVIVHVKNTLMVPCSRTRAPSRIFNDEVAAKLDSDTLRQALGDSILVINQ